MSGRVGDLNAKQEAALNQFKENTKDVKKATWDDYYFLRWLRARNFDVKKAEKMLRENIEWRKKIQADDLPNWEAPEVMKLYYPGGELGEDKAGCPLIIDCLGYMDNKGLIYSASKKDFTRWNARAFETLEQKTFPELSKKHGKRIDEYSLIFDMDHIGLKHLWKPGIDMFTHVLSMFEANYPEIMKITYVINAPKIFPVLWNVAKPFLHEATRKKIKVFGRNYQKHLLEDIDAEVLPVHWGGTRKDPDGNEFCKSLIGLGGKVPEKYRLKNMRENIDMSNFENCTVQRGSTIQLHYDVKEPGSSIRWQFLTEGNDIGFGIFRRTSDERQKKGEMEEVVKSERVDSHVIPEEGTVIIDVPGTYVARFDNTYSLVNSKKVAYLIEVMLPDKEKELEITEL